jgi:hypothetical protein
MPTIDLTGVVVNPELESSFWRHLRAVVTNIFKADEEVAERYQLSLAGASPAERMLAMHESPLEVAASLTGTTITTEHIQQCERLLAKIADRAPADGKIIFTPSPITLEQLDAVLYRVGYRRLAVDDKRHFLHWMLDKDESLQFPRLVTLSAPQFASDGISELVYDRDYILDALVTLYGDAIRLGAAESEAVLLLRAREELRLAA